MSGNDMLTGLDALVERAAQEENALRNYLHALSERLQTACLRADIYCATDTLKLEEAGDDEWVFGYIYCDQHGLKIASAFSGDTMYLMDGEEISYSVTSIKDCPVAWLRVICRREVIEAFLNKVQERVLQRTDELAIQAATAPLAGPTGRRHGPQGGVLPEAADDRQPRAKTAPTNSQANREPDRGSSADASAENQWHDGGSGCDDGIAESVRGGGPVW